MINNNPSVHCEYVLLSLIECWLTGSWTGRDWARQSDTERMLGEGRQYSEFEGSPAKEKARHGGEVNSTSLGTAHRLIEIN